MPSELATFRWPSGTDRSVAILSRPTSALEDRGGLRFTDGRNGLGDTRSALLTLPSGTVVLFEQNVETPDLTVSTHVLADYAADAPAVLAEVLATLDLSASAVAWAASADPLPMLQLPARP